LWLHSLKVAQLLRSAACLHTNQSRSYLNHLVFGWLSESKYGNLRISAGRGFQYLRQFIFEKKKGGTNPKLG